MSRIIESTSFDDIPAYDKAYWWAKMPEERLEAARILILRAKAIYSANPQNPTVDGGRQVLKSDQLIKRRGR